MDQGDRAYGNGRHRSDRGNRDRDRSRNYEGYGNQRPRSPEYNRNPDRRRERERTPTQYRDDGRQQDQRHHGYNSFEDHHRDKRRRGNQPPEPSSSRPYDQQGLSSSRPYDQPGPSSNRSYDAPEPAPGPPKHFSTTRPIDPRRNHDDQQPSTSAVAGENDGGGGDDAGGAAANSRRGDTLGQRKRPDRLEMVVSRNTNLPTKCGNTGQQVQLTGNFFQLRKRPSWNLFQYRVEFEPDTEIPGLRKRLIYEQKPTLGGYLFDTKNIIYLTQKLANMELMGKDRENNPFKITLKFVAIVEMNTRESLQVLNIILRRAMEGLKLQLIGRNFYDPLARHDIREYNLQLWPGYQTSIRQHEQNVLLCAEITNKVMRTETILSIMTEIYKTTNIQEAVAEISNRLLGMTVLTDYTNKTYRIDDIDFDTNPSATFDTKNGKISFIDYYHQKYNIRIKDPYQPMLISKAKEKDLRNGKDQIIALVPELCRATGLSEPMRKNFQLMKRMGEHFRMNPNKRISALLEFTKRLQKTKDSMDVLKQFNFELDTQLVKFPGRILKNELILLSNNQREQTTDKADWQNVFHKNGMYTNVPLKYWYFIYPQQAERDSLNFLNCIKRAAGGMRFDLAEPTRIPIYGDRNNNYLEAIEKCASQDPQMLVIVVPNNNSDRYSCIKVKCCVDRAIPTQVLCQRTIGNQKRNPMSIATKVVIQMNCKLGGIPWMVDIPLSETMIIGIDVSKDTLERGKTYGAFVASLNLHTLRDPPKKENETPEERDARKRKKEMGFFSVVSEHRSGEELSNSLCLHLSHALKAYSNVHRTLPAKILIYRDGVGEGQTSYVYEHEVEQIKLVLAKAYAAAEITNGYRMCFIVVSKKINSKIFMGDRNPPPGTVVDDVITLPERYDFLLVSQSVGQGTVSPTSYNVLFDNMGLSPDKLQQLTYKQTHLYYNWSGTTRVPAVCQFAHKLAFLVGQFIHKCPSTGLQKQLYFL